VEFKFDPLVNPRTDCSQSPLAVRLTPEQAVSLEFRDTLRRSEYRKLAVAELAEKSGPQNPKVYTCGGGQNGCAIDPTGHMSICVLSQKDGYELRDGSFAEGWSGRIAEIRKSERARQTICSNCKIQTLCSMCAAMGELENGDAESPVEFLCQVAHLRAYALGLDVPEHGDCPNCAGGVHEPDLRESAGRIRDSVANYIEIQPLQSPGSLFPVLQARGECGAGGCASCGKHAS
jgi:radical SAM protein with 4Fe4S-binding SPASM domain